ncbi:DinB superfamily protein [Hanstruepera neustonica]|uniref:DinB superfamily protein n=1 Tax=Hanstruepera neustonica TaxID=1445657 RepID=A0A2K1DXG8_9FLAO|nr:DinB superfamily protein [Hanstruepera neustonica]
MLSHTLTKLFVRDLTKLQEEIQAYSNEKDLWKVTEGISNSAGNLCLHLVGNLNHFIGAELGNTGYIRQRDLEFSSKDVPRETLLEMVDDTKVMITESLKSLTEAQLQEEYRRNPFEDYMTTEYFLVHLTMHLAYHLGQINYHRRLLQA